MRRIFFWGFLVSFVAISCGKEGSSVNNPAYGDNGLGKNISLNGCPQTLMEAEKRGCEVNLLKPKDCVTIEKEVSVEGFSTGCETPYLVQIFSHPFQEGDDYQESSAHFTVKNARTFLYKLSPESVRGVESQTRWYHLRICNAYRTGCSETIAFRFPN